MQSPRSFARIQRVGLRVRRAFFCLAVGTSLLWDTPCAQARLGHWELRPGVYGTWGQYTNVASSRDFAGFLSVVRENRHSFSLGYGDLNIVQEWWTYRQRTWVGGGLTQQGPILARGYYGHIRGDYHAREYDDHYRDLTDFYNAEIGYVSAGWSVGYGATYLTGIGGRTQKVVQHTARVNYSPDLRILFTLRPNYSWLLDGRRLTSMQFSTSMSVSKEAVLKIGGSGGKRAYYFDNDLLVIFNQDETQLGTAYVHLEITPWRRWTLVSEYLVTDFENYDIAYLVAGIKGRIR